MEEKTVAGSTVASAELSNVETRTHLRAPAIVVFAPALSGEYSGMSYNRFRMQNPDEVFEKLITRMCRAGWIDAILQRGDDPLQFHFTPRGKERFRAIARMMDELGNGRDLMAAEERSELLAIVEAWIPDVEEQQD